MEVTVLGSGGCMVIPKPLCQCSVCREARQKGIPFERSGPALFVHDENILIDTPAQIGEQLNRCDIRTINYLLFTHLDPDHTEGFRVVEQMAIDFRTWQAYPDKCLPLVLPMQLLERLKKISTAYGSQVQFYEDSGFVKLIPFEDSIDLGSVHLTALPVDRGDQVAFVYVMEKNGLKIVVAPCDIKPFPEDQDAVQDADVLFIQPGIFEKGLKHGFVYPEDHISRTTLYTLEETMALSRRIRSHKIVFIHLEEYWNRSYTDYSHIQNNIEDAVFAYDGMQISIEERGIS